MDDCELPDIDEVLGELSEARLAYENATTVSDRLDARAGLERARDRVANSESAGLSAVPLASLRRRAASLRQQLAEIDDRLWSPARVAFSRGLSAGFDRDQVEKLNADIADSEGRPGIVRRLRTLDRELARREALEPQAQATVSEKPPYRG